MQTHFPRNIYKKITKILTISYKKQKSISYVIFIKCFYLFSFYRLFEKVIGFRKSILYYSTKNSRIGT